MQTGRKKKKDQARREVRTMFANHHEIREYHFCLDLYNNISRVLFQVFMCYSIDFHSLAALYIYSHAFIFLERTTTEVTVNHDRFLL